MTLFLCDWAEEGGGFDSERIADIRIINSKILIGVDNNNQIIGAEIDNNKRSAIQDTIGEISPALKCEMYPIDVEYIIKGTGPVRNYGRFRLMFSKNPS